MYVIKKSVETDILKINEYKTIGSIKDDEKIDMFDTFKPNENFKVRMWKHSQSKDHQILKVRVVRAGGMRIVYKKIMF